MLLQSIVQHDKKEEAKLSLTIAKLETVYTGNEQNLGFLGAVNFKISSHCHMISKIYFSK